MVALRAWRLSASERREMKYVDTHDKCKGYDAARFENARLEQRPPLRRVALQGVLDAGASHADTDHDDYHAMRAK